MSAIMHVKRSMWSGKSFWFLKMWLNSLALSLANGPVPKAGCTMATSRLMAKLPGFKHRSTFSRQLAGSVARLPGVETTIYREDMR